MIMIVIMNDDMKKCESNEEIIIWSIIEMIMKYYYWQW